MTNKKYKCFDLNVSDNIANLVLSRPNDLNTMSRDFWVELGSILEEINRNSDIRVVVMSSTGKHFCAGMDLSAFSNGVEDIPDNKNPIVQESVKLCIELQRNFKDTLVI